MANREFHKKNIKEKAAHLASMFGHGDFPQVNGAFRPPRDPDIEIPGRQLQVHLWSFISSFHLLLRHEAQFIVQATEEFKLASKTQREHSK